MLKYIIARLILVTVAVVFSGTLFYFFIRIIQRKLIHLVRSKIGLIKIDCDGSDEIDVLKSCKEVIEQDHPHIFIEARTEEKLKEIEEFLTGYKNEKAFNVTPTYYFKYGTNN